MTQAPPSFRTRPILAKTASGSSRYRTPTQDELLPKADEPQPSKTPKEPKDRQICESFSNRFRMRERERAWAGEVLVCSFSLPVVYLFDSTGGGPRRAARTQNFCFAGRKPG